MFVKNNILNIQKITDTDDNTYVCVGKNKFTANGKEYFNDIKIERKLRVKSKLFLLQ